MYIMWLHDRLTRDGVCAMQVTIVGRVRSIQEQSTKAVLSVDDGTASIEVQHWLNDDGDNVSFQATGVACWV